MNDVKYCVNSTHTYAHTYTHIFNYTLNTRIETTNALQRSTYMIGEEKAEKVWIK